MYSQCPDCQTRFRVTADVLRAAHGTVRCGRCGSAFDALARLSDTLPPARGATVATRVGASPTPLQPKESKPSSQFHFTAADLEQVFVDARDWNHRYGPTGATGDPSAATGEPSVVVVDESEPLEDITLEGERIQIEVPPGLEDEDEVLASLVAEPVPDTDPTDRFAALSEDVVRANFSAGTEDEVFAPQEEAAGLAEVAQEIRIDEGIDAPAPPAAPAIAPEPVVAPRFEPERRVRPVESIAPRRWQPPSRAADDDELPFGRRATDAPEEEEASRAGGIAWTLGSLLLALALLAQLTHYFRQDLVRHPQIGPALSAIYERLGLDLAPNWDPRAFEIRQWGDIAPVTAEGRMSVRASIRNKAAFAQPFPLLRLELEDRFGAPVATRDFEPAEYLKLPALASRLLGPGASADADLEIVDPGSDAVGYRLDVCLRESAEILRCAQGPG